MEEQRGWEFVHSSVGVEMGFQARQDWFHGQPMELLHWSCLPSHGILAGPWEGVGVRSVGRNWWEVPWSYRTELHMHDKWRPWLQVLGLISPHSHLTPRLALQGCWDHARCSESPASMMWFDILMTVGADKTKSALSFLIFPRRGRAFTYTMKELALVSLV